MKKRIISIALALCIGLGMLPITVQAATNGHTQDEAVQWVKSMADSHWSISDGSTWTQCTEFVWQYYTYLGYDHPRGHAYQYLTDTYNPCPSGSGWTRPNINTARPGDIVIWDQNAYFREDKTDWAGSSGHIGIIVSVNGNTMITVEANAGENYGSEHGVCGYKYNREVSCISGLIRPDFPSVSTTPTVAFSVWENNKYTYIRETDASIGQQIDVSGGTCTKTGMILYDNNRKELGRAENPSYTDHRVFFKVNEELGITLSPGTTYQYRFWAAVNGKIYYGDYKSFKTSGTANIAVTGISVNRNSLSLKTGESTTLTATVSPSNATDKTVTWSSSNTKVATVSGGKVTAVAAGTATITAKAGNKSATCTVTVSNATVEVTGISLNKTSLSLTTGGNATLTAAISPSNATDKTVTWSSSNTKIATVSGGKVTAVAAGTATITAKAGNKSATCTVTVSNATVAVTGLRLNKISLTLTPGATETLTATVMPSNATDQTVTWSSNDTSVVTVDKNGKVTAIAAGSAKITAEAGGKTVTCTVTVAAVTVAVTSISLNKTALTLNSGETATLTATISPNNLSIQARNSTL